MPEQQTQPEPAPVVTTLSETPTEEDSAGERDVAPRPGAVQRPDGYEPI